jgi:benzoyl-CoA reductase/2-hydroxyglutaryl-CoA dehydratase subunit BcrC/BadD/HgdB
MNDAPAKIDLAQWDARHAALRAAGLREPPYGGPLGRHFAGGDLRLARLAMDNSPAALRLWNFLLTEEDRLNAARAAGRRLVGAMKDLGTVPVMAYSAPELVAFYPDGAWWAPCVMEMSDGLLAVADSLGVDESFCPVRAMLGAFATGTQFPRPDLLACSVGATCDDLSAIAQRLEGMGHPILWWEMPHRRPPDPGEESVTLPGGFRAPACQVAFARGELERVRQALGDLAGHPLDDATLAAGIAAANRVRRMLGELRELAYSAEPCPLPALEMLIAEMLAIHFCSDRQEAADVLAELLAEARRRVAAGVGVLAPGAARVYWVNPVADLRVMNLLEDCGGRACGTDYMFCHALEPIPEDCEPMEALARAALADPMVGSSEERAERICREARRFGAEGVVVSRIPGASHCATEGAVIGEVVAERLGLPVVEIEAPPLTDGLAPTLRGRIEALVETIRARRARGERKRGERR